MIPIGIKLSDEVAAQLESLAQAAGLTSAQIVSMGIQLMLSRQPAELRELHNAMEQRKKARNARATLVEVKV